MGGKPPVPEDLTDDQKRRLKRWARKNHPMWATGARLRFIVADVLDYHRGTGNRSGYVDFEAVCRNRIRGLEAKGWDPCANLGRGNAERPQETGRRTSEQAAGPVQLKVVNLEEFRK